MVKSSSICYGRDIIIIAAIYDINVGYSYYQ